MLLNTTLDDEIGSIRPPVTQIAICNLPEQFSKYGFFCVCLFFVAPLL